VARTAHIFSASGYMRKWPALYESLSTPTGILLIRSLMLLHGRHPSHLSASQSTPAAPLTLHAAHRAPHAHQTHCHPHVVTDRRGSHSMRAGAW
jgi:hypothetical protein